MHYASGEQPAVKRGGAGLNAAEVVLAPDEWITRIEGSIVEDAISSLLFLSNKGSRFTGQIIEFSEKLLITVVRNVGTLWNRQVSKIHFGSCGESRFTSCLPDGVTLLPRTMVSSKFPGPTKTLLTYPPPSDRYYVRQLKATFAEYPGYSKPGYGKVLKFEKHTGAGSNAESVGLFSTFARYVVFVSDYPPTRGNDSPFPGSSCPRL